MLLIRELNLSFLWEQTAINTHTKFDDLFQDASTKNIDFIELRNIFERVGEVCVVK